MNFSITSKLDKREYTKIMFIGLYKKPVFIISTIFGIYLVITVFLDYLQVIDYYYSTPFFEMICGSLFLLFPSLIVLMAVSQYKSNPSFQNEISYTFSDDGIVIQGLTFKSDISWAHIIKQKELGKFLILYHTKKFGDFIDKSKLSSEELIFIKSKITKK